MHRPGKTLAIYRRKLPHWEVENASYFVTLSLHGALPPQVIEEIRDRNRRFEREAHLPALERSRIIFKQMEQWLDCRAEVRWLEIPEVARSIMESIRGYEERDVWKIHEYVIMPTHAHLYFEFLEGAATYTDHEGKTLDNFMDCFKRLSGRRANSILSRNGEKFWQREWFDRWTRTQAEAEKVIRYIQNNPIKAGLVTRCQDWPFGSWAINNGRRE